MLQIAPHVKRSHRDAKTRSCVGNPHNNSRHALSCKFAYGIRSGASHKEAGLCSYHSVINGIIKVGLSEEEITYLSQAKDLHKNQPERLVSGSSQETLWRHNSFCNHVCFLQGRHSSFRHWGHRRRSSRCTGKLRCEYRLGSLGVHPITVVCAGAKAILDLPATLEYLETKGVLVVGYKTDEFPAFYYGRSGLKLEHSVTTPGELAQVIRERDALEINKAILVGNPPPENMALEKEKVEKLIEAALHEAKAKTSKAKTYLFTPFLLDYLAKNSQGETLETNIALVKNNAYVGS